MEFPFLAICHKIFISFIPTVRQIKGECYGTEKWWYQQRKIYEKSSQSFWQNQARMSNNIDNSERFYMYCWRRSMVEKNLEVFVISWILNYSQFYWLKWNLSILVKGNFNNSEKVSEFGIVIDSFFSITECNRCCLYWLKVMALLLTFSVVAPWSMKFTENQRKKRKCM